MHRFRRVIDRIDRKIIRLLARRYGLVREIGRAKQRAGAPVRDPGRERAILSAIEEQFPGNGTGARPERADGDSEKPANGPAGYVQEIYRCIFRASRRVQGPGREQRTGRGGSARDERGRRS